MTDDTKITLSVATTFVAGWLPSALYGHPQAGIVWGVVAVTLQFTLAFAFDGGEHDD